DPVADAGEARPGGADDERAAAEPAVGGTDAGAADDSAQAAAAAADSAAVGEAADADEAEDSDSSSDVDEEELFRQSEIAADYVEGLLDVLDMDGDIDELIANGRPVVEVVGGRLQSLIGPRGATLEALQD